MWLGRTRNQGATADLKKRTAPHPEHPSHETGSSNWMRLWLISLWERNMFYVGMSTFESVCKGRRMSMDDSRLYHSSLISCYGALIWFVYLPNTQLSHLW